MGVRWGVEETVRGRLFGGFVLVWSLWIRVLYGMRGGIEVVEYENDVLNK